MDFNQNRCYPGQQQQQQPYYNNNVYHNSNPGSYNQYSSYQQPQYDNYNPNNYNNNQNQSGYYYPDVNTYPESCYSDSYYSYPHNNSPQGSGSFDQQHEYYQYRHDPVYENYGQQNYYGGEYLGGSQTDLSGGENCYYYSRGDEVNNGGNNEQTYDSYDYRRDFELRNCE